MSFSLLSLSELESDCLLSFCLFSSLLAFSSSLSESESESESELESESSSLSESELESESECLSFSSFSFFSLLELESLSESELESLSESELELESESELEVSTSFLVFTSWFSVLEVSELDVFDPRELLSFCFLDKTKVTKYYFIPSSNASSRDSISASRFREH